MQLMSAEHVAAMNELLEHAADVRSACAALPRPLSLGYLLAEGPGGGPVHWHVACTDTVRFSLSPAPADVVYVGRYGPAVRAMLAARAGDAADPGFTVEGDADVLALLAPVLALAATVATIPVDPPEDLP